MTPRKHISSSIWIDFTLTFRNHLLSLEFWQEYNILKPHRSTLLYYSGVHQPGSEFNVESWLLLFFVPASLFDLRLGPFALEFINRTPKVMSSRGIRFFWFNYETIWILSSAKDSILYKAKHVDSRVQSFPSWVELWTLYTYTQYQYSSKKNTHTIFISH